MHTTTRRIVYEQISWLHDQGVHIWYDEGISPGEEWGEELGRAISGAERLIFFVSPASVASRHCRNEVHYALNHAVPVIAIHLEPTELPAALELAIGTSQAILKHELSADAYQAKVLGTLAPPTEQAPIAPMVQPASFPPVQRSWVRRHWILTAAVVVVARTDGGFCCRIRAGGGRPGTLARGAAVRQSGRRYGDQPFLPMPSPKRSRPGWRATIAAADRPTAIR